MTERDDAIIVIGAGLAGLAAARELSRAGLRVLLLEARDRIGGRVFTVRPPGLTGRVELGAEFVHGVAPELFELLPRASFVEVGGPMWCHRAGRLDSCNDFFPKVDEIIAALDPGPRDRSFLEYLDEKCPGDSEPRHWALQYVEGFHASRAERISVRSLIAGEQASDKIEGNKQFRIQSGYDQAVNALNSLIFAKGCEIRLNTPVQQVRWRRGSVEVDTISVGVRRTFHASKCVITLPLGLLQRGLVRFEPKLHAKTRALSLLAMGAAQRVTLAFRLRFWEELRSSDGRSLADLGFLFSDDDSFPTWWTEMPLRNALLTAWAAGPKGEKLSGQPTEAVIARALASLSHLLGVPEPRLRELLLAGYFHDWVADPYAGGGYSYVLVGGEDAERELADSLAATLFFAGEASNYDGHNSTTNGAIATGYRAAREVLEGL